MTRYYQTEALSAMRNKYFIEKYDKFGRKTEIAAVLKPAAILIGF
jgi:hypothetical protein